MKPTTPRPTQVKVTSYEYEALSGAISNGSHLEVTDLAIWVPRADVPAIIESLARQLGHRTEEMALIRFPKGELLKSETCEMPIRR